MDAGDKDDEYFRSYTDLEVTLLFFGGQIWTAIYDFWIYSLNDSVVVA
jgi:hypothetical protein